MGGISGHIRLLAVVIGLEVVGNKQPVSPRGPRAAIDWGYCQIITVQQQHMHIMWRLRSKMELINGHFNPAKPQSAVLFEMVAAGPLCQHATVPRGTAGLYVVSS